MNIKESIEKLIEELLEAEGFELVDIEYGHRPSQGMTLTIYVDKRNSNSSITLKDCELLSEKISFLLDKEEIIEHSYSLEISSPGIYRRLKKERDFKKFISKRIKIQLYSPVNNQKNFLGYIENCENNILTLRTLDNKLFQFKLSQIAVANLEPEIKF